MVLVSDTNNKTDMFPAVKFDPSAYCMEKYGVEQRPGWMNAQYWGKGKQRRYQNTTLRVC